MEIFGLPIIAVAAFCAAAVSLMYMTYTDMRYFLLPDKGNIVLAASGVLFHVVTSFYYVGPVAMIVGAVSGSTIFMLSRWYGLKVKKVDGVGLGDVKFAAAAGIWLGPFGVSIMILASAVALLIIGSAVVIIKKRDFRSFYLPFGAMACPVTLILIITDIYFIRLAELFG